MRMHQSMNVDHFYDHQASLLMGKCEDALRQAVASQDEQLTLALLVHLKRHQYPHDDTVRSLCVHCSWPNFLLLPTSSSLMWLCCSQGYMRLLDRVPRAHSSLLSLRRQQSSDPRKLFQVRIAIKPAWIPTPLFMIHSSHRYWREDCFCTSTFFVFSCLAVVSWRF